MKHVLIIAVLVFAAGAAFGMAGGPIFCVGQQMTAMTVEATKVNVELSTANPGGGNAKVMSDRMTLTARYGVAQCLDLSGSLGAADLTFSNLSSGYSNYDANWSFAWGAGIRGGLPVDASRFQVIGAVNYLGFQPTGSTGNGSRNISSKYLWHEVTALASVGMRAGPMVPYIGACKPYLFGRRQDNVSFNGRTFSSAGGKSDYSDGSQSLRGLAGLEWKLPEGYSIAAEVQTTPKGVWTLSIGVAQVLK
jgi:hypothetical protein